MSSVNRKRRSMSRQEFWQQHFEDYERSCLTQKQYCQKHGLALSTFSYWKKKLTQKDKKSPQFYPLMVRQVSSPQSQTPSSGLSLTFGKNKFRIELEESFSAGCLKKVILALEQL